MRPLLVVFLLLLSTPVAFAQNESADDKVKKELKKLHAEYKEAAGQKGSCRARTHLRRWYCLGAGQWKRHQQEQTHRQHSR